MRKIIIPIVVIGIIAFVWLLIPTLHSPPGQAKFTAAEYQIANFRRYLQEFKDDVGRYPSTQEGLDSLLKNPSPGLQGWNGPYIQNVPMAPWGRPYEYIQADENSFTITCYSPDGKKVKGSD